MTRAAGVRRLTMRGRRPRLYAEADDRPCGEPAGLARHYRERTAS
jgi:hypothetical protein